MPGKFILLGVICDLRDEKSQTRTNNFMVGRSVGAKSASYGEARQRGWVTEYDFHPVLKVLGMKQLKNWLSQVSRESTTVA
jgi:hypothetical protein